MKRVITLFVFFLLLFVTSCETDDATITSTIDELSIEKDKIEPDDSGTDDSTVDEDEGM